MAEIVLNRPGVLAVVGQLVAAGMSQHVDQKREPCRLPRLWRPSADIRGRTAVLDARRRRYARSEHPQALPAVAVARPAVPWLRGGTAGRRCQERESVYSLPSPAGPVDRAARCRASRRLSPPGGRVRNGVWRLLRMVVEAIIDAIAPKPDVRTLHAATRRLQRHLREPPRKRVYQNPVW